MTASGAKWAEDYSDMVVVPVALADRLERDRAELTEVLARVLEIAEDAATDDNWPTIKQARAILARLHGEGGGV